MFEIRVKYCSNISPKVKYKMFSVIQMMACRRVGKKSLSCPIVTQSTDARRRYTSAGLDELNTHTNGMMTSSNGNIFRVTRHLCGESDNGLEPVRQQAIIWINDSLVYWHIYASLGFNELKTATTPNCFGNAGLKIQTSWRIICYYWTYQLRNCGHPKYMHDHCPIMMTSSNGNVFRVTGPLCGEFTDPRWIPLTKASDAGLWCLLSSVPE